MKKIAIKTSFKKMLSDVHTPVGIYLRLRDRFREAGVYVVSLVSSPGAGKTTFLRETLRRLGGG